VPVQLEIIDGWYMLIGINARKKMGIFGISSELSKLKENLLAGSLNIDYIVGKIYTICIKLRLYI